MNPKAVFGVGLREQGRTLEGIEFYKNLIEVTHKQFRRRCLHKWILLKGLDILDRALFCQNHFS
jgi:hypothetical protein